MRWLGLFRSDSPLNIMYWSINADGTYELLDGQQRTLSLCQYLDGEFSLDQKYFHSLPADQQAKILDYRLMVYICDGEPSEKLDWFKIVNIAGEELTEQELLNAQHVWPWLTDAKRHFSKSNCPAYLLAKDYLSGHAIRQEYLEKALEWCSGWFIQSYMSTHQFDQNASELWQYFLSVINRVKMIFPNYRKEMKGLDWGTWYNQYKDQTYNAQNLEVEVKKLMEDDEVENKKGIYPYLLTGKQKYLNLRSFPNNIKSQVYETQNGICPHCHEHFGIGQMEADHITPWSQWGKTTVENCQMLCRECNRRKSDN